MASNIVVNNGAQLEFDADLTGRAFGSWNIVATNGSYTATLADGIRVNPGAGVRAAPSPFNPIRDTRGVVFFGLSGPATAKIFTISGEWVRDISGLGTLTWDGRDIHGRYVASGIYIACVTDDSGTKRIKIAVQK